MICYDAAETYFTSIFLIIHFVFMLSSFWVFNDAKEKVGEKGQIFGLSPRYWMVIILLISFIGLIAYFILRNNTSNYKRGSDYKKKKKKK